MQGATSPGGRSHDRLGELQELLHDGVHERSCQVNGPEAMEECQVSAYMRASCAHTHPSSVKYLNF